MNIINELLTELKYNEEDGNFYWLNAKQGRQMDRPAGTTNHNGYTQIKYNSQLFMTSRLTWYLHTGELPDHGIGYRDGNPRNTRWDNLKPVSHVERTLNFRNSTAPKSPPVVKKVRRATFSNSEVQLAVQEYLKEKQASALRCEAMDKILVEGVYVSERDQRRKASSKSGVLPTAS